MNHRATLLPVIRYRHDMQFDTSRIMTHIMQRAILRDGWLTSVDHGLKDVRVANTVLAPRASDPNTQHRPIVSYTYENCKRGR